MQADPALDTQPFMPLQATSNGTGAHRVPPVRFALRHGAVTATVAGSAVALAGPIAAFQAVVVEDNIAAVQRLSESSAEPTERPLIPGQARQSIQLVDRIPEQADATSLIKAAELFERAAQAAQDAAAEQVAAEEGGTPSDCEPNSSGFGAVKPWVASAGHELRCRFDVDSVGGVAGRAGVSDHPLGLALDMIVDRATGDSMAEYLLANMDRLKIKYVIWKQRINYGSGWKTMEDRGGATANHFDHVHISFGSR